MNPRHQLIFQYALRSRTAVLLLIYLIGLFIFTRIYPAVGAPTFGLLILLTVFFMAFLFISINFDMMALEPALQKYDVEAAQAVLIKRQKSLRQRTPKE
jgi:glucan phosphoethanolaminetransferase (alkaline phosphatase superfamily)